MTAMEHTQGEVRLASWYIPIQRSPTMALLEIEDIQDRLLFTPGPITTSSTVKGEMLRDVGSRGHGVHRDGR